MPGMSLYTVYVIKIYMNDTNNSNDDKEAGSEK